MLTQTEIARAIRTATTETVLIDTSEGRGTGSLRLRIRPTATGVTATWVAAWGTGKTRAFVPIGKYPAIGIAEARTAYRTEIVPALIAGKDPRIKTAAAGKPTVRRLFAAYVGHMRGMERQSADEVERVLLLTRRSAAAVLGPERLAGSVDPGEIASYLASYFQAGHRGAADKARAYIHAAYAWGLRSSHDYTSAHRQDWGLKSNPAAAVARDAGAIGTRDRNLSAREIRLLWEAAGGKGFSADVGAAIRLLIATGQRVKETLRVEGAEIDLISRVWNMPTHKTKTKIAPHSVPLPPQAVEICQELISRHGAGPLFPARRGSAGVLIGYQSVSRAIQRWNASGQHMALFECRDLRRTWKSRAADAGIDKHTRDLIQQHARGDTGSRVYDRADYSPQMRAAMDRWGDWLGKCLYDN